MVHSTRYLPFAMFKIDNGGINKHRGQESDTVDFRDVDRMQSKITDRAEFYTKRFLDYICFNSQKFPEYNNNSKEICILIKMLIASQVSYYSEREKQKV